MRSITDIPDLSTSWQETCRSAGVAEATARLVFADLTKRYSSHGRFYHTLAHVAAMLQTISVMQTCLVSPDSASLQFAVWFHDAVYDPRAADDEEQSAEYAGMMLATLDTPEHTIGVVQRLILATKRHQAAPEDVACRLLLDADLAILGASPHDYETYVRDVRREYAWVPEPEWRVGRARVLTNFLGRPQIYQTLPMHDAREDAARRNLHDELKALT